MTINHTNAFPQILLALGMLLCTQSNTPAQTATLAAYPAPPGLRDSSDLKISVNGTSVWTERVGGEEMEALQVANFSCAGPQTIAIEAPASIGSCVIRPKALGIAGRVNGKILTLTIPGPQKLYVEIDHQPHLAIFANPLEVYPPKADVPNIRFFGAGAHDVADLQLHNDETVYIAGGAVVNANRVAVNGVHNARIIGRGVLNAASGIIISQSENIEIDGIFIRVGGSTPANTVAGSNNIAYRNVKVFSHRGLRYADGIDVVSSRNVQIDDCFIRTRGNCIAVTTPQAEPADNITVSRSMMAAWAYGDGFTIGFAVRGPVQNVQVKDCDILYSGGQNDVGGHAAFSVICNDAGAVSNIRFENIRVEENQGMKNFELDITEGQRDGSRNRTGAMSGVYLKNVSWENPRKAFVLAGIPTQGGHFPTDITFDNCKVGAAPLTNLGVGDFRVEYVREIKFIPSTPMTRKIVSQE